MDDKTYFTLIGAAIAVYGLYCLYIWFKLVRENYLFYSQLLIPTGLAARDCKRPGEYIKYMKPRLLFFGLVITISGVLYALTAQFLTLPPWGFWLMIAVPMLVIIWFIVTLIVVRRRFWDD